MANYNSLKAAINAYIKRNGQRKITGDILNAVLNAAVDALGAGYQFMGVAGAATDPGTPDVRLFYLAGAGTYTHFGDTVVPAGSIGIFSYGDEWDYTILEIGGGGSADAVLYVEQSLTTEQQAQARENIGAGTGNGTYSKPGTGIPKTDLAQGVQDSLGLADTAYQKPSDGIPASDIEAGVIPDVSGKADKVAGATAGNFAGLDASGDLTDSGSKASDFATAAQGTKADTAYQKPSGGIPATDLAAGVIPTVPVQDVTLSGASVVTAGVAVLPGYPTTLPASDVYAWAKAENKPSYDYSEIADTPIDYTDAELQTAIDTAFANI